MRAWIRFKTADRKYQLFVLFILAFFLYFFNFYYVSKISPVPVYKSKCDFELAKHIIENLCSLNKDQDSTVIGGMCSSLCDSNNQYEYYKNYRLVDCHIQAPKYFKDEAQSDVYDEFKTVLIYELNNNNNNKPSLRNQPKRLVLKSRQKYFLDFDTHMDFEFEQKSIQDQINYLFSYLETNLEAKYSIKIDKNSFNEWINKFKSKPEQALTDINNSILSSNNFFYYIRLFTDLDNFDYFRNSLKSQNKKKLSIFIRNFVVLLSQEEYLFYKFFQLKPGSLKIYASCGHFYLVEYAESLSHRVSLMSVTQRKSLALQFLNLVQNFDNTYLFERKDQNLVSIPIQICDAKLDNFGLNESGDLKLIDTDMAYPNAYLFNSKVCNKHDDCHFFDCKSFCDPSNNRCLKIRINNNLQAICEKIFFNLYIKSEGLLTGVDNLGSNVHSQIINKINQCKSPGFYHNSDIPIGANYTLLKVFQVLLNDKGITLE